MASVEEILQMCRLCLVKEQVNVPIFDDPDEVRQIFLKITACLPVKISREDNLPKKICDGCLYKLDLLYQFSNTSSSAETQLHSWLNAAGLDPNIKNADDIVDTLEIPPLVLKQEPLPDRIDSIYDETNEEAFNSCQDFSQTDESAGELFQSTNVFNEAIASSSAANEDLEDEMPAAKRPRRAAAVKAQPNLANIDSDEEIDDPQQITKTEDESEEEEEEEDLDTEPAFVNVAEEEQPGPSGIGKITTEAPLPDFINPSDLLSVQLRYKCEICSEGFESELLLGQHSHAGEKLSCTFCGKKFPSEQQRSLHENRIHLRAPEYDGIDEHKCDVCGRAFGSKRGLSEHRKRHFNIYDFKCEICEMGFHSKQDLKVHVDRKHHQLRYECNYCHKIYKDHKCFKEHTRSHETGTDFACGQCEKSFCHATTLQRHIKEVHFNIKTDYVCDVCGKTLAAKSSLRDHMMIHTGEKPFPCETCGKTFNKKELLKKHIRVHTKEKPYHCTLCKKTFTQKSVLNIHMRAHAGDKPHKCVFCEKAFLTKTILKKHLKVHQG